MNTLVAHIFFFDKNFVVLTEMSLQRCGETVSLWNKIYVGFKNAQLLGVNNLYQTILMRHA